MRLFQQHEHQSRHLFPDRNWGRQEGERGVVNRHHVNGRLSRRFTHIYEEMKEQSELVGVHLGLAPLRQHWAGGGLFAGSFGSLPGVLFRLRHAGKGKNLDSAGAPQAVAIFFCFYTYFRAMLQALIGVGAPQPLRDGFGIHDMGSADLHLARGPVPPHDQNGGLRTLGVRELDDLAAKAGRSAGEGRNGERQREDKG